MMKLEVFLIICLIFPLAIYFTPNAYGYPKDDEVRDIMPEELFYLSKKEKSELIIIDVRSELEYSVSHLFNAINIPYNEILNNISSIISYKSEKLVIYCRTGNTSEYVSNFLKENYFSQIFNLIGGIEAWVEMDYPVSTVYHDVIISEGKSIEIQPTILKPMQITPDNFSTCGCSIDPSAIDNNEMYDNESYLEYIIRNFEEYENTSININTIYNLSKENNHIKRYTTFIELEIDSENVSIDVYVLNYKSFHRNYNLSITTILNKVEENLYNKSYTVIYLTAPNKDLNTMDFIDFNIQPVKLSEHYKLISLASKYLHKKYLEYYRISKSNEFLELSKNYQKISIESNSLSLIIQKDLIDYNYKIQKSTAVISDTCNYVAYALCMAFVAGIDLFGCGLGPVLFCSLSAFLVPGIYGGLWGLFCALNYWLYCDLLGDATQAQRRYFCFVSYLYTC